MVVGELSQEDVEHLRRGVEHYERTGEPLWDDMDAEFEIHEHDAPDAQSIYHGHDGWHQWEANFAQAFESYIFESEELIDAGDGKVVQIGRMSARGAEGAACWSSGSTGSPGRSATARRYGSTTRAARRKPSKPRDCWSRRCRRRTSSWLIRPMARSTGAISTPV
jgi:hypothetical protein